MFVATTASASVVLRLELQVNTNTCLARIGSEPRRSTQPFIKSTCSVAWQRALRAPEQQRQPKSQNIVEHDDKLGLAVSQYLHEVFSEVFGAVVSDGLRDVLRMGHKSKHATFDMHK